MRFCSRFDYWRSLHAFFSEPRLIYRVDGVREHIVSPNTEEAKDEQEEFEATVTTVNTDVFVALNLTSSHEQSVQKFLAYQLLHNDSFQLADISAALKDLNADQQANYIATLERELFRIRADIKADPEESGHNAQLDGFSVEGIDNNNLLITLVREHAQEYLDSLRHAYSPAAELMRDVRLGIPALLQAKNIDPTETIAAYDAAAALALGIPAEQWFDADGRLIFDAENEDQAAFLKKMIEITRTDLDFADGEQLLAALKAPNLSNGARDFIERHTEMLHRELSTRGVALTATADEIETAFLRHNEIIDTLAQNFDAYRDVIKDYYKTQVTEKINSFGADIKKHDPMAQQVFLQKIDAIHAKLADTIGSGFTDAFDTQLDFYNAAIDSEDANHDTAIRYLTDNMRAYTDDIEPAYLAALTNGFPDLLGRIDRDADAYATVIGILNEKKENIFPTIKADLPDEIGDADALSSTANIRRLTLRELAGQEAELSRVIQQANTVRHDERKDEIIEAMMNGEDEGNDIARKLRQGILSVPEKQINNAFQQVYGISLNDSVYSYVHNRVNFQADSENNTPDVSAATWFDADGDLNSSLDHNILRPKLAEVMVVDGGTQYENFDDFYNAVANEDPGALFALKLFRDLVLQREASIPQEFQAQEHAAEAQAGIVPTDPPRILLDRLGDMLRYGDGVEKAAVVGLGALVIWKGVFGKGFVGKATRVGLVGFAAHEVAKNFGFNIFKEAGLLDDAALLRGSAAKAMYDQLHEHFDEAEEQETYNLNEWEKEAIKADDEKTAAIIAMQTTPLEDLLDWHRDFEAARTDEDREQVLTNKWPSSARFFIDSMPQTRQRAGLSMGVLSLFLRQAAQQYSEQYPEIEKGYSQITPDIARKLVRAKYFGTDSNEAAGPLYEALGQRFAHQPFRADKENTVFAEFIKRETHTTVLLANQDEADNILGDIYEEIKNIYNIADIATLRHAIDQLQISATEFLTMAQNAAAELGPDIMEKIDELGQAFGVPTGIGTWQYIDGQIRLNYDHYTASAVPYIELGLNAAGTGLEVTWDVFTLPFDALILLAEKGYAAFEELRAMNLDEKAWAAINEYYETFLGVPITETISDDFAEYLRSDEAYGNDALGHFADQFETFSTSGSTDPYDATRLAAEQGGAAVFAYYEIKVADHASDVHGMSEAQKKMYFRDQLLELATDRLNPYTNGRASLSNFDPQQHLVAIVSAPSEPGTSSSPAINGVIRAYVRIPYGSPMNRAANRPSQEVKTYDWLFEHTLQKFYTTEITVKSNITGDDGRIIYRVGSTENPQDFIQRMSESEEFLEQYEDVRQGLRNLEHEDPSRQRVYLKNPNQLYTHMRELLTENFSVDFT